MNAANYDATEQRFDSVPSNSWTVTLLPHTVFCLSLIATAIAWKQTNQHLDNLAHERFSSRVKQVESKIESRMLQYEQVLRGGIALHAASETVSRTEWRTYVSECQVQQWFPGIQCIGVALPVAKEDATRFEESIRSEGFPDFEITPTNDRDVYTAIKFIEPFDWRNQRAFGYDMYSNPVRREAMNRAARTGLPTISGKITLVQETKEDVQSGILCYLPLYKSGIELEDADEREKGLQGWVYAAFRCNDLMSGILGEHAQELNLQIYDAEDTSSEYLLFDSRPAGIALPSVTDNALTSVSPIKLSGRNWTFRLSSQPGFFTPAEALAGPIVVGSGILVSLLLYAVLISVSRQRERAICIARQMTCGLSESEQRTRSILENVSEAILSVSEDGRISAANRVAHTVFQSSASLAGQQMDDLLVDSTFRKLVKRCVDLDGSIMENCRRLSGDVFPCCISLGKFQLNGELSHIVVARDETARIEAAEQLAEKNRQLVDASHKAGMAEVATGVLHNVGNVLNSVNVSANLLGQRVESSSIDLLANASSVIKEHESNLGEFFSSNSHGKHFSRLLCQLALSFENERDAQLAELRSLTDNVGHINEIVSMQQSFARTGGTIESIDPIKLFEDALRMNDSNLDRHDIDVVRDFAKVPLLHTRKHAVLQILVNLIRNSQQALEMAKNVDRTVQLSVRADADFVHFQVTDTGVGIPPENLKKIFQHGFTTKKAGHGFGLHSCANAAQELGGSLTAKSDGHGKGATFTVTVPVHATDSLSNSEEPNRDGSTAFANH